MKYRHVLGRRTLLRGAGTVAIGLPFLDEMRTRSVWAAPAEPPVRAFNVFFGLGYPTPILAEGYEGKAGFIKTLDPLAPLKAKLSILRGVHHTMCDNGDNAHYDGAGAAFTGTRAPNKNQTGGASLDQALRREKYPNGLPTGVIPTLCMGVFFRRSDSTDRYLHSRNEDGAPTDTAKESPVDLFARIFGEEPSAPMTGMPDAAAERKKRLRRSVLDSVLGQYKHFQSEAGNLSAASRSRMAEHLEQVRQLELRSLGEGGAAPAGTCAMKPAMPARTTVPNGNGADPGGEGIDITFDALVGQWRVMADLYAAAIRCDRTRFGTVVFQSAGERIRLKGAYQHGGQPIYNFDDRAERGGGAGGCSHEWWHAFNPGGENRQLRAHLHLMMREVGYFLGLLDAAESRDGNGKSILDNSMITVSTESGDGRHDNSQRELSGVFHAISGANGKFKTGGVIDVNGHGVDLYNSMLEAVGVQKRLRGTGAKVGSILV